ncbi:hypothetical protein KO516_21475 [Citreicella sp. C3M06]|uniref:hypothetical protein n=1 Tax=Citreicella sp. C3M06 TaxID=2841564 RepID=UPI001C08F520|nr:hypothetical protein [Citreicella sp. C3M06]MBU2963347.1 hypothetical protein [Citreicella sp. C3M06]
MGEDRTIAIRDALPRDREVQHVVSELVSVYAFSEAHAVLGRRLREIEESRQSRVERLFIEWRDLDPKTRPDFLTYSHHRRNPELTGGGEV